MDASLANLMAGVNIYTLLALALWTLPWKAWAMWLSARRGDFWWFIAFSLINTIGILEILYIFLVAKQRDTREPQEPA
jgi:hypothetical protein